MEGKGDGSLWHRYPGDTTNPDEVILWKPQRSLEKIQTRMYKTVYLNPTKFPSEQVLIQSIEARIPFGWDTGNKQKVKSIKLMGGIFSFSICGKSRKLFTKTDSLSSWAQS